MTNMTERIDGKDGMDKKQDQEEFCCDLMVIRRRYSRYHQFFIGASLLTLGIIGGTWFANRAQLSAQINGIIWVLFGLVILKEVATITVSGRIDRYILKPIEVLKNGLYEVSRGNYGHELAPVNSPEFAELIRVFNNMSKALKESEQEKQAYEANRRDLISSISHDLRTPITSINGYIDGIVDGVANSPEKRDAYFRIIQQNARYMNKLIEDLSLYSELNLHRLYFECLCIEVGSYVNELIEELSLELEDQGVALEFVNGLAGPVSLVIDGKLMTRAIRNIVNNGVAYGRAAGAKLRFELVAEPEAAAVVLRISDNGPGIAKDQLEQIFQRFYRGEGARSGSSGSSGLGLAIAREVVKAHGGTIWAESELGQGTTMNIRLKQNMEATLCQRQGF